MQTAAQTDGYPLCGGKPGLCGGKPGLCGGKPGLCGGKPGLCGGKPGLCGGKPGLMERSLFIQIWKLTIKALIIMLDTCQAIRFQITLARLIASCVYIFRGGVRPTCWKF